MEFIRSHIRDIIVTVAVSSVCCFVVFYNLRIDRNASEPDHPSRFEVIDKSMSWHEAKEYCEGQGGYLAVITSDEEQAEIEYLLRDRQKRIYWIGLFYDHDYHMWRWVNDEDFLYSSWDENQPHSRRDIGQDFGGIVAIFTTWGSAMGSPYKWHDFENEGSEINPISNFGFIMEKDIAKQD